MDVQVEIVARRNIVVSTLAPTKTLIDLVQGRVYVDESIYDGGAVERRHRKATVSDGEVGGRIV